MSKTRETPEELNNRINQELGVNLLQYKNEELAETFLEILVFPIYALSWIIRPVMISVVLFIVGFFIIDLVHIEYIIYAILGLVLFLVSGILFGILFFSNRLESDLEQIMDYSFGVVEQGVQDMKGVKSEFKNQDPDYVIRLLSKGVISIITIPVLGKVIENKIPFLGGIIGGVLTKALNLVADRIVADSSMHKVDSNGHVNVREKEYNQGIINLRSKVGSLIATVTNVVRTPFRIVFLIFMLLTLFLCYLLN